MQYQYSYANLYVIRFKTKEKKKESTTSKEVSFFLHLSFLQEYVPDLLFSLIFIVTYQEGLLSNISDYSHQKVIAFLSSSTVLTHDTV